MIELHPERDRWTGCWRCHGDTPMFMEVTTLAGEYHAKLCAECANDFEKFMRLHPLWIQRQDIQIETQVIASSMFHDGEDRTKEMRANADRINANQVELHALAEEWVAATVERPKADAKIKAPA